MSRGGIMRSLHTRAPGRAPRELPDRYPQSGDLIISPQPPPNDSLTVSQMPGVDQISVSERDAAAELASSFARRHRVDLWEKFGDTYSLVGSYRPNASQPAAYTAGEGEKEDR